MKHIFVSFLTATIFAAFGSAVANAADNSHKKKRIVQIENSQLAKPINAGFSTDSNSVSVENRVDVSEVTEDLRSDGTGFGWIDEDGMPLEVMTSNDEILFKRMDGRVSRLKMTDMSGVIEPQIGTSAVTVSASTMTK